MKGQALGRQRVELGAKAARALTGLLECGQVAHYFDRCAEDPALWARHALEGGDG